MQNLITLEMDEHLIPKFKAIHKKGLEICNEVGAILDLATSDTTTYLYAPNIEAAQKVADVYKTLAVLENKIDSKYPNMNWYCIECSADFYEN